LPLLCVVNLVLFAMLAPHWWIGALVGLCIGGAFCLTCMPAPASRPDADPSAGADTPSPDRLAALLQRVLPAWSGNVQLARAQTQDAIDNLTERFGGIHDRLGGEHHATQGNAAAELLDVIHSAADRLGGIAASLESVLASRQALMTRLQTLDHAYDDIRHLAQHNAQLAEGGGEPDLLGQSLSWQEVAARTADNSRQIVARAKSARQQIQAAMGAAGELPVGATELADNSRTVIDQVVADFRQSALRLSDTVERLEQESREVDREVCDILLNLQFQDRISQILGHVLADIDRLLHACASDTLPVPEQWLDDLERTYTTHEQRQMRAGPHAAAAAAAPQSQVDFF